MKIHLFGHSAFQLISQQGTVILIDPYGKFLGYRMPKVKADIVAVTHEHKDHNQIQVAEGPYELINQPGHFSVRGVEIQGVPTYHDNVEGAKRGKNILGRNLFLEVAHVIFLHAAPSGKAFSVRQYPYSTRSIKKYLTNRRRALYLHRGCLNIRRFASTTRFCHRLKHVSI